MESKKLVMLTFNLLLFTKCCRLLTRASGFSHYADILPAGNYMFKVNNRNTRRRSGIFSKLRHQKDIIDTKTTSSRVSIVDFEQVSAGWGQYFSNSSWPFSPPQPQKEFGKKDVFPNFTKFTGKHLCWSIFLIKLQALFLFSKRNNQNTKGFLDDFKRVEVKACNFIQKETQSQVLPCKICDIFKNTFFTEHLELFVQNTLQIPT